MSTYRKRIIERSIRCVNAFSSREDIIRNKNLIKTAYVNEVITYSLHDHYMFTLATDELLTPIKKPDCNSNDDKSFYIFDVWEAFYNSSDDLLRRMARDWVYGYQSHIKVKEFLYNHPETMIYPEHVFNYFDDDPNLIQS